PHVRGPAAAPARQRLPAAHAAAPRAAPDRGLGRRLHARAPPPAYRLGECMARVRADAARPAHHRPAGGDGGTRGRRRLPRFRGGLALPLVLPLVLDPPSKPRVILASSPWRPRSSARSGGSTPAQLPASQRAR